MANTASPPTGQPGPQADLSRVVPFGAPTMNPNEPVTAGAAVGPGPGMESLGLASAPDPGIEYIRQLLPSLSVMATLPSAGREFRQFVRRMQAMA
jgi:hypothetical protein